MRTMLLVTVLGVGALNGLAAEQVQTSAPLATHFSGPKAVISQVSQTPKHEVAISWEASDMPADAKLLIQRAGGDHKFRTISRAQPPQSGRFLDDDRKRFGETYFYRLEIQVPKAEPLYSETANIDFTSSRIPFAPTHLQGKFARIDDKHYVELTWDGVLTEASGADHFRVFQMTDQELVQDPNVTLIRKNAYRYEVTRQSDMEVTLGIAAVSAKEVRSEIATVRVMVPGTFYPAPAELSISSEKQSTTISWKYEPSPTLTGFRIFHGENLLLDERQVPPDARSATVQLPPGTDAANALWIQAVSRLGMTSWRVRASGKGEQPAPLKVRAAAPPIAVEKEPFHSATPPQRIDGRPQPGQKPDPWYKAHTPLMAAADLGDAAEVSRLIAAGEDVNIKCRDGLQETALMLACRNRDRGYEAAKLLIQAGADVNARFRGDSYPALMLAVRGHSLKCVKLLIENGARLSLDNGHGITALDWAREEKDEQIIQVLEQAGAK